MNTDLNIFIVEDMAVNRMALKRTLLKKGYKVAGSSATAEGAWKKLQHTAVDLVLIDINLVGDKTGVWLAQQSRKEMNLPFVFLTAYGDDKTLEEVTATRPNGYIMKPYNKPTLFTALSIAMESFNRSSLKSVGNAASRPEGTASPFVYVKTGGSLARLIIRDILYVKADGNYVHVVMRDDKYMVRSTLKQFHGKLPQDHFIRIHKGFVVNIKQIDQFNTDSVRITSPEIPIAKSHKALLIEAKKRLS